MLREHALNLDQLKIFSENCKPIRVRLWLVYKITDNSSGSRLFAEAIHTPKWYPTSFDKVSILTWGLLVISKQNFSFDLNSSRTYSLENISYMSWSLVHTYNTCKIENKEFSSWIKSFKLFSQFSQYMELKNQDSFIFFNFAMFLLSIYFTARCYREIKSCMLWSTNYIMELQYEQE